MIQGGEITKHDGTGGVSIYGDYFDGAWISLSRFRVRARASCTHGEPTARRELLLQAR